MPSLRVSDKGQVTLPAKMRKRLGIKPGSRLDAVEGEGRIILMPQGSAMDAYGALHEYARGDAEDWETVRSKMERSVAEEVKDAGKR